MDSRFVHLGFVPALGPRLRQGGVQDRRVGRAGRDLCLADRICARNLVVEFPVRRPTVVAFAAAVPVPETVTSATVRYADPHRYARPAVLICPEFTPAEIKDVIGQGKLPELAKISDLNLVDIDSGHWPMITKPAELARIISEAAGAAGCAE